MRYKYHRHYNSGKKRFRRVKARFQNIAETSSIYRSRKGIFMGVCRGVAEHFNFSVFWFRAIVFTLFLFSGFWPVGVIYIIAGLLLKLEPVAPFYNEKDYEFYDDYTHSRESAIQRIKRKYENIERRIQRMEHTVTSREFDWQ